MASCDGFQHVRSMGDKFQGQLGHGKRKLHTNCYATVEEAAKAVDRYVFVARGPNAPLNFPLTPEEQAGLEQLTVEQVEAQFREAGDQAKPFSSGRSAFRGVSFNKSKEKWRADIRVVKGKPVQLGLFIDERDAAIAYDAGARRVHGSKARLNFSDGEEGELAPAVLQRLSELLASEPSTSTRSAEQRRTLPSGLSNAAHKRTAKGNTSAASTGPADEFMLHESCLPAVGCFQANDSDAATSTGDENEWHSEDGWADWLDGSSEEEGSGSRHKALPVGLEGLDWDLLLPGWQHLNESAIEWAASGNDGKGRQDSQLATCLRAALKDNLRTYVGVDEEGKQQPTDPRPVWERDAHWSPNSGPLSSQGAEELSGADLHDAMHRAVQDADLSDELLSWVGNAMSGQPDVGSCPLAWLRDAPQDRPGPLRPTGAPDPDDHPVHELWRKAQQRVLLTPTSTSPSTASGHASSKDANPTNSSSVGPANCAKPWVKLMGSTGRPQWVRTQDRAAGQPLMGPGAHSVRSAGIFNDMVEGQVNDMEVLLLTRFYYELSIEGRRWETVPDYLCWGSWEWKNVHLYPEDFTDSRPPSPATGGTYNSMLDSKTLKAAAEASARTAANKLAAADQRADPNSSAFNELFRYCFWRAHYTHWLAQAEELFTMLSLPPHVVRAAQRDFQLLASAQIKAVQQQQEAEGDAAPGSCNQVANTSSVTAVAAAVAATGVRATDPVDCVVIDTAEDIVTSAAGEDQAMAAIAALASETLAQLIAALTPLALSHPTLSIAQALAPDSEGPPSAGASDADSADAVAGTGPWPTGGRPAVAQGQMIAEHGDSGRMEVEVGGPSQLGLDAAGGALPGCHVAPHADAGSTGRAASIAAEGVSDSGTRVCGVRLGAVGPLTDVSFLVHRAHGWRPRRPLMTDDPDLMEDAEDNSYLQPHYLVWCQPTPHVQPCAQQVYLSPEEAAANMARVMAAQYEEF